MHFQGLLFTLLLLNGDLYNVDCAFEKLEHFVHQRETRSTLSFNKEVGCPDGWKALGKKCYFIESDSPKSYDGAASYCRNLGGFLASIHSKFEQDFLTAYLGESDKRGNAWIGLKKKMAGWTSSSYILDKWDDQSVKDYSNFAPGEPSSSGSHDKCIHMEHAESVAGKWNDHACNELKGFLCQLTRIGNIDENTYFFGNNDCPEGWQGYRDRCYKLVYEKKNWKNAEAVCQTYGSRLVSISDSFQEAFISFLLSYYGPTVTTSFWIGLSDTDPRTKGRLTWSDASLLFHTNWGSFKEPGISSEPRCAAVQRNKLWGITNCSLELPFVCAKDLNQKNKSQTIFHGHCPPGWKDFGSKYCYYVEAVDQEDFTNAKLECGRKAPKAKLAEFLSEDEMRLVLTDLKSKYVNKAFWMGIKAEHYEFKYVTNGSIRAYLPWGEGEPNYINIDECAALSVRRFSYYNMNCIGERHYICQTDKDVIEQIELHGHVLPEPPKTRHRIRAKNETENHIRAENETENHIRAENETENHIRADDETKNKGAKIAIIVVIATVAIVAFVATLLHKWHQKKTPRDGADRVTFHNQD